jgi:hypothetical protein
MQPRRGQQQPPIRRGDGAGQFGRPGATPLVCSQRSCDLRSNFLASRRACSTDTASFDFATITSGPVGGDQLEHRPSEHPTLALQVADLGVAGLVVNQVVGRTAPGSVAGQHLDGDLAVEVHTRGAPALTWAGGTSTAIGTPVFALSNPGGRGLRVTFGFVSGAAIQVDFDLAW